MSENRSLYKGEPHSAPEAGATMATIGAFYVFTMALVYTQSYWAAGILAFIVWALGVLFPVFGIIIGAWGMYRFGCMIYGW